MEHSDSAPFVISKAAAGSGKTFTLVLEYLKIALAGPRDGIKSRFRGILAITFTNKAAGEMKSRIMNELDTMANEGVDPDDGKSFGAALFKELQALPCYRQSPLTPADLQAMAAELQSAILHRYTDLSVFTIDSFMHRIVRTFAHDLGKPVQFEVMTDKKVIIDEVVGQLMALVGTDGNDDLTRLLQAYADSNMDSDLGYNIETAVKQLAERLFDEDIEQRLRSLAPLSMADWSAIHRRLTAANRAAEQRLKGLGEEFLALVEPTGAEEGDCANGAKGYLHYFRQLARGGMKAPNTYVAGSMTGGKLESGTCPKSLAGRLEGLRPQMERIYGKVVEFFERDIVDYNTRVMLLANLYSTALLGRLYALMGEYSQEGEVLHLAEFNRMINSIVEDEENPAPFIFERLGNRYSHFLIDEFQDTSIMQWHNLVPLVENGVASRQESLVVGDAKQAIYRFRQGDVRQFVALPRVEGMLHHGSTLPLPGNSRLNPLDTNFRTTAAVVDFNNSFFSWLVRETMGDNTLAQEIYIGRDKDGSFRKPGDEELRQRKSKADEGHVCVELVDDDDATKVYAEVKATIELLVGERGYSYRDIMILARSNDQLAKLSAWLTANSAIPQTSRQSFLLHASDAAMAVVAALRWVHNRRDRVAAAELQQRLVNLGLAQPQEDPSSRSVEALLDPDSLASLDLYDLCEELVRRLQVDDVDTPYVGALMDAAASFAARHRQQVGDFLDWLAENDDLSASTSDQLDAVQLLTVHKAKGLQKPVVICVFFPQNEKYPSMWVDLPHDSAEEGPQLPTAYVKFKKETPTRLAEQCDREMALGRVDDLNVLYVALTRPEEQLYIICLKGGGYPAMIGQYFATPREEDCRPHLLSTDPEGRIHVGKADWCKADNTKQKHKKEKKTVVPLRRLSFADWSTRVAIASPSEKAATSLLEDRQRFGTYAHELMSAITCSADVEPAFEAFCKRYPLSDSEKEKFLNLAQMAVSHPEARRFFAPGNRVVGELPFFDCGCESRPDRVVFADGETWVVDFKTGAPAQQNITQVRDYCRRIAAMGYPAVSGWLLYLHDDGVDVVPVD